MNKLSILAQAYLFQKLCDFLFVEEWEGDVDLKFYVASTRITYLQLWPVTYLDLTVQWTSKVKKRDPKLRHLNHQYYLIKVNKNSLFNSLRITFYLFFTSSALSLFCWRVQMTTPISELNYAVVSRSGSSSIGDL